MAQKKEFTIYKASAGAGKTFTLAVRYIELLIQNPAAYQETLAVTFTNKATEEMKMRILAQLFGLWKGLEGSKSYMQKIQEDLDVQESYISKRAGVALLLILHDYSNFQVQTIDAFFQRVLRNLARELDLTANLRVELNDHEVESLAVDNIVNSLTEHHSVMRWLINYVEEKMSADKSWDVITGIKAFGTHIFEEPYKIHAEALNGCASQAGFFEQYKKTIRRLRDDADSELRRYGEEFFAMLEEAGYSIGDFFRGTTGPCGYFIKLSRGDYSAAFNATAQNAADGPEGWLTKSGKPGSAIYRFAEEVLVPYINKVEDRRRTLAVYTETAGVILSHLNELRMLNDIRQEVQRLNQEENRFLLSDTQNILHSLMKDSDAPFIFEKIGARLRNIMIDEFQDTSSVQWQNFSKLLQECLSNSGSENLVVGDIKQSIYRWRSGDWRLLKNLTQEPFLKGREVETVSLGHNHRSEERVVMFNNWFFIKAAPIVSGILAEQDNPYADLVGEIYSRDEIWQDIPDYRTLGKGEVDVVLLDKETYAERCFDMVRERIESLTALGAMESDIAIIVRDKANISALAEQLQAEMPQHRFVSEEAFRLQASVAVNIMIDAVRLLLEPDNALIEAELVKRLGEELPDDFLPQRGQLLRMPLTELFTYLFRTLRLDRFDNEAAYVNALMDHVANFAYNNVPDHRLLLKIYDESLCRKTVQGGRMEGIRIITIHKSKGLEYKYVILPFCDWKLNQDSTLWCSTDKEPFSDIPVLPVMSTKIRNTIYSKEYNEEMLQVEVDNLNMLYVAFTRARTGLYVIGKESSAKKKEGKKKKEEEKTILNSHRSGLIQMVLPLLTKELEGSTLETDEDVHFHWGQLEGESGFKSQVSGSRCENVFEQASQPVLVGLRADYGQVEFRQSNASKDFLSPEDVPDEEQAEFIAQGIVMHDVLSRIESREDIDFVLNDLEQEGILQSEAAQLIRRRLLENMDGRVEEWFAPGVTVYNECDIIYRDPQSGLVVNRRPDRVVSDGKTLRVIDFKFGSPKEEHKAQVRFYMRKMKEMGYTEVEGYLWYVYQNKVLGVGC